MKMIMKQLAISLRCAAHDAMNLAAIIVLFLFFRILNASSIPMIRAQNIPLAEVVYANLQSPRVAAMFYVPVFLLLCGNAAPRYFDMLMLSRTGTCLWNLGRVLWIVLQALAFALILAALAALNVFPAWIHRNTWVEGFLNNELNASNLYLQNSVIYAMSPQAGMIIQIMQLMFLFAFVGLMANCLTLLTNQKIGIILTMLIQFLLYSLYRMKYMTLSALFPYRYFFLSEYSQISHLLIAGGAAIVGLATLAVLCHKASRRYRWYSVK